MNIWGRNNIRNILGSFTSHRQNTQKPARFSGYQGVFLVSLIKSMKW